MAKNKLYKHHKSKFVLAVRNFSLGLASFVAIVAIAAIPTYLSTNNVSEANAVDEVEIKQSVTEEEVDLLSAQTQINL